MAQQISRKTLLTLVSAVMIFIIICWQTIVHLNIDPSRKTYQRYGKGIIAKVFTPSKLEVQPLNQALLAQLSQQATNADLTLTENMPLKGISLQLGLTKDYILVVIPHKNLAAVSNIAQLYPTDNPSYAVHDFTYEQLQKVTYLQDYKVIPLAQVLPTLKEANVSLWVYLPDSQTYYLQSNIDFAQIVYQAFKVSQISPARVNFIDTSPLTLSHLRNDFIRKEKVPFNLVYWVQPGLYIPTTQPDVNLSYTSYMEFANKLLLDSTYVVEKTFNLGLSYNWYLQTLAQTQIPTYLYVDQQAIAKPEQILNLIQHSRYKGIVLAD
ncbi:PI-PLC domain-containing protein [Psittacicella hinzii]|uniref:Uncharacterized protein n=1 Tax=Psittacicella hinzii TaxID=2028575 RepID=A0A3A1YHT5_9GAMM|nr:hypothetical protein [Psittacicella hinzii]RIY35587.1 hypothetical protein CKF58_06595 [Psittacicella hinzii]